MDQASATRLEQGMPGVTLFRNHNVVDTEQLATLTRSIHRASSGAPPIVAIDQEAGQMQALAGIVTDFPGNLAMAATGNPSLTKEVGRAIGKEMCALGFTVNYAPVCDHLVHATNHVLSVRTFGSDPKVIADHAAAMVYGLQAAGVAATAKHFPGKGAASVDVHYETALVRRSRSEFDETELVPFRALFDLDVRMVMTSHIIAPELSPLEPRPASLSREILTRLLRHELGFDGVTVTDALDMASLSRSRHVAADALRAGADLLLTTPSLDLDEFVSQLDSELDIKPLSPAEAQASHRRVHALRQWAQPPPDDLSVVNCLAHQQLAREVARHSLTEVNQGEPGPLASDCVVIQPRAKNLSITDVSAENTASLADALRSQGLTPTEVQVGHTPTRAELSKAMEAADGADLVLVITAAATEPDQVALVHYASAVSRRSTIIIARNPGDLRMIGNPRRRRIICTYGFTESTVDALAHALSREEPLRGKLPIANPLAAACS